ncbi:hypothetical protein HZA87_05585 [Candidatus Uhrbacteria bacterium]|nr:hypothetical protein [Candidatus Uhrbacteria bacterium]
MDNGGLLLEEGKETRRMYRLSLWWVEHRALLRRLGYIAFIAVDALVLLFALYQLLDAFALSFDQEQRVVYEMVAQGQSDLHSYTSANKARDLEPTEARVISIGKNRYDLYATLVNPNSDWWAEITYSFDTDLGATEPATEFILPAQEKPIVEFAYESSVPVGTARLTIEDVIWHRVDHHLIDDWGTFVGEHLNLSIEDAQFTKEVNANDDAYGRSSFTVTNKTAYSYYEPTFYVLLKRGSSVVGVNRATLSELDSGESADVTLNWFGTLPSVSEVAVVFEINLFDLSVYKPLEGENTLDTRGRVFNR